jgi:hypothetical protein
MATAFEGVKEWPAKAEPNPRVAIGNNQPAIEDRVLAEYAEALDGHDGLIARIDALEKRAADAGPCQNADTAGRYADFCKMVGAAKKVIEAERETINRPLLNAQRALKGKADGYVARLNTAEARVRGLLNEHLAEQERARREAQRKIDDEAREAAEKVRRELEAERQRLQAIEDELAAKAKREAVVVEVAPAPEPAPVVYVDPPKAQVRGDYGSTASLTETWHVEVENIRHVPDTFLKHPSVIEALQKVIGPVVRGKNGLRDIKGCRIYPKTGSVVR